MSSYCKDITCFWVLCFLICLRLRWPEAHSRHTHPPPAKYNRFALFLPSASQSLMLFIPQLCTKSILIIINKYHVLIITKKYLFLLNSWFSQCFSNKKIIFFQQKYAIAIDIFSIPMYTYSMLTRVLQKFFCNTHFYFSTIQSMSSKLFSHLYFRRTVTLDGKPSYHENRLYSSIHIFNHLHIFTWKQFTVSALDIKKQRRSNKSALFYALLYNHSKGIFPDDAELTHMYRCSCSWLIMYTVFS